MSSGYYSKHLSGERLRRCYDVAPPRVQAYLRAEIDHAAERLRPADAVLELGCGYGRILKELAPRRVTLAGVDTSEDSLRVGRIWLRGVSNVHLACMDAAALGFSGGVFDVVLCLQNGLSAFGVDRRALVREAVRVTRPGGRVLLSSYARAFWPHRLEWFRMQAAEGLIGAIDESATGDGVIVCRDGFRARTISAEEFETLAAAVGRSATLNEVDASSVFCELAV
ncbi:MAG: class I SAM-dependent methyltransferase [Planctomycetes bacterium]|nr:class I SAM-dependent methyltransferase [Planctomycetota bacterium]